MSLWVYFSFFNEQLCWAFFPPWVYLPSVWPRKHLVLEDASILKKVIDNDIVLMLSGSPGPPEVQELLNNLLYSCPYDSEGQWYMGPGHLLRVSQA